MALGTSLEADLLALTGGDSQAEAAGQWADAMESYATGVVPALAAGVMDTAKAALEASLTTAFASVSASATATAMEAAFLTFSTTMAGGMAPAFIGAPPPLPVGFLALLSVNKDTKAEFAADWEAAIDTWMRTGVAQAAGGPPPPPINWS